MAFLYYEMDASETREFESHLRDCDTCRDEAASFGIVRESIAAWRDEVLKGFVPSTPTPTRKSALAAFRQFFDLSPRWLRIVEVSVALAAFVLAGLFLYTLKKDSEVVINTEAKYTEQDVRQLIDEALAKQKTTPVADNPQPALAQVDPPPPRKSKPKQNARSRRPLSRAEREQLAADLRLLPTDDDLDLLGDRINYEEKR
jgi:hypothetical protein